MSIRLNVLGDYACFTRLEMKGERVTYDVMTPSAARGILDSIFWHPGLRCCLKNKEIGTGARDFCDSRRIFPQEYARISRGNSEV